jgi:predicted cupin superfamily sugar epimerase
MDPKKIIEHLHLLPHPEGGYYRETYRSDTHIQITSTKSRNTSTAIYYLLENDDKSCFHRIQSDEMWFFHLGLAIEIMAIQNDQIVIYVLGSNFEEGELLQVLIPSNTWFAARVKNQNGYSLVSCTVAPGFDFEDFELAERTFLVNEFPHLKETIELFTH